MTDVCLVTHNRGVNTGNSDIHSRCVANVVRARVVVIAVVFRNRSEYTACCGVARVVRARVVIVAGKCRVLAFRVRNISRILTDVCCALVVVVTVRVAVAGRNRRAQVGEVNNTCCGYTLVVRAHRVGGYRNSGENTTHHRVARGGRTEIRGGTRRDSVMFTHSGGGDSRIRDNTGVCCARVVVITVLVSSTLRDRTSGLININTSDRVTRDNRTTVRNNRERYSGLNTTHDSITQSGVTDINRVTRDDRVRTEVLEGVCCVGHVAHVCCAHSAVITSSVIQALWNRTNSKLCYCDIPCC